MRTDVAIIGAGPAGLVLGRLLQAHGITSVILEARDRAYVEQRVRAGLLEPGTVELLGECGVGERLRREGMVQPGFDLRFDGCAHHIPVAELTGRHMTVYAQAEIVQDLIAARLADGEPLLFGARAVRLDDIDGPEPSVTYVHAGHEQRLHCDVIAGCDGFHGVARASVPAGALRIFEHLYPFAHLGILADVPPASDELIYARHEDGLGLLALRRPDVSRLYVQCEPDADLADWPDERVWAELHKRLATRDGFTLREGPVLEKGVTQVRSFVAEPMRYGRLFLAGDAAHVVPPNGAKGLNMAAADAKVLATALGAWRRDGDESLLRAYSDTCLRRVWRVQRFSTMMVGLLHRFPDHDAFQRRLQLAQLQQVVESRATARSLAESYVGAFGD